MELTQIKQVNNVQLPVCMSLIDLLLESPIVLSDGAVTAGIQSLKGVLQQSWEVLDDYIDKRIAVNLEVAINAIDP